MLLESLQEYLLVAQDRCHIDHYRRQAGNAWVLSESNSLGAALELPSVGARLALADVYDKVEL